VRRIMLETSDAEKTRPSFETRKIEVPVEFILASPVDIIYCPPEVIYEIGKWRGSRIIATPMHARSRRAVHSVTQNQLSLEMN
jgi:hypothetical protein